MGIILEIRDGPMAGKVIGLTTGETVTFGRAAGRAQFALPHDTFMSGVHFAVECGTSGCRVQDRKSSNGTFLNGARIQDAMLANGDEIKSGQTIFAVKIVADAKLGSLLAPQEVIPPSTPQPPAEAPLPAQPRPYAAESAPPAMPDRPPRTAEPPSPSASAQPPRAAEIAPPAGLEPRVRAGRPVAGEPLAEQEPGADARGPTAGHRPPAHPPSAHGPSVEPSSPVMRTADLDEAAASRSAPRANADRRLAPGDDDAAEPRIDSAIEPGAPKFLGALEPPELPGRRAQSRVEVPANSALPNAEEPPHLRAIPSPPVVGGQPQRGSENAPGVSASPPGAPAKPPSAGLKPPQVQPRGSEPPAGVAPYMAEKFAERPGARDAGGARSRPFSVMGWSFPGAPAEWQVQEGFGLQQSGHEEFPSSVAATEELLGGITLQQFVESQISVLRGYLRDPKIEPTMPPRVGGADESVAVDVRHSTKDGMELVYRRIYARSGSSVGVLTVTTLAADLPQVLQSLQPLLDGAAFRATVNN